MANFSSKGLRLGIKAKAKQHCTTAKEQASAGPITLKSTPYLNLNPQRLKDQAFIAKHFQGAREIGFSLFDAGNAGFRIKFRTSAL